MVDEEIKTKEIKKDIDKNEKLPVQPGVDLNNILDKTIYDLECLEIAASQASDVHKKASEKLGNVARKGTKLIDPRKSATGKVMIEKIAAAKKFQKDNFGIISEPGVIGPTIMLIRKTILLMKKAGEI